MSEKRDDFENKIKLIDKYYKDDKLFLKMYFDDYNTFHIYIRLDYEVSSKSYKLRWFDLDRVKSDEIKCYESSEYLEASTVDYLKFVAENLEVSSDIADGPDCNVSLFMDCKCKNKKNLNIRFYKNIPNGMKDLSRVFEVVFFSLPKKINAFYEEVCERGASEYQYEKTFKFNLFNDDLSLLFDATSEERGRKFYKEDNILYLEKMENKYVGVIIDDEPCAVVVKYDGKNHDMRVQCSCPMDDFCKHIYAVIKAIRDDKFNDFYKVMPKKEAKDKFSKEKISFKSMLCVGVINGKLAIINNDNEVVYCDIFDSKKNLLWDIVEDDNKNRLTDALKYLKNK